MNEIQLPQTQSSLKAKVRHICRRNEKGQWVYTSERIEEITSSPCISEAPERREDIPREGNIISFFQPLMQGLLLFPGYTSASYQKEG